MSLTRRSFLASTAVVPMLADSFPELVSPGEPLMWREKFEGLPSYDKPERVGSYVIFWTGFKLTQTSLKVVGQWIGWPSNLDRRGKLFYSSVPGEAKEYFPGEEFETTSLTLEQIIICGRTPVDVAYSECLKGKVRLLKVMREAGCL